MSNQRRWSIRPCLRGLAITGLIALSIASTFETAAAEGLFGFLFGAPHRPSVSASTSSYADPSYPQFNPFGSRPAEQTPRIESGPSVSYCVRLCDGRFFPIQRSAATPAQVCNAFCPAARTKIFSGGAIEHAVASDGSHYGDLPNAFSYRTKTVADCTCNGKDAYGLVNMSAENDPTLRPGDIVATNSGLVAYSGTGGGRNRTAEFTPVQSYSGISGDMRRKLSETKVERAAPVDPATTGLIPTADPDVASARRNKGRRVQLER